MMINNSLGGVSTLLVGTPKGEHSFPEEMIVSCPTSFTRYRPCPTVLIIIIIVAPANRRGAISRP